MGVVKYDEKRTSSGEENQLKLTNSSSTVVLHFSKLILLIAHFSFRGRHSAACTTAVAPAPGKLKFRVLYLH